MVIWLIGLSGAGKTTIGDMLYNKLKPAHANLVRLDGDTLREVWGDNLGHTVEARATNAHRISHLSRLLDHEGIHAIAAVLSIFPEWQAWNRANLSRYFEIFLDMPMATLRARDPKGLYAEADAGRMKNVVGIDIPFPTPPNPDLVLNDPHASPEESLNRILSALPPLDDGETASG